MLRRMWHTLCSSTSAEPDDDILECSTCGVEVADGAVGGFTLSCPAAPCEDPMNLGKPCEFLPGKGGSACSYCLRPGRVTLQASVVL